MRKDFYYSLYTVLHVYSLVFLQNQELFIEIPEWMCLFLLPLHWPSHFLWTGITGHLEKGLKFLDRASPSGSFCQAMIRDQAKFQDPKIVSLRNSSQHLVLSSCHEDHSDYKPSTEIYFYLPHTDALTSPPKVSVKWRWVINYREHSGFHSKGH